MKGNIVICSTYGLAERILELNAVFNRGISDLLNEILEFILGIERLSGPSALLASQI